MKEYHGNKKDVSLFAVTRYLKMIKDVPDVSARIAQDFNIKI